MASESCLQLSIAKLTSVLYTALTVFLCTFLSLSLSLSLSLLLLLLHVVSQTFLSSFFISSDVDPPNPRSACLIFLPSLLLIVPRTPLLFNIFYFNFHLSGCVCVCVCVCVCHVCASHTSKQLSKKCMCVFFRYKCEYTFLSSPHGSTILQQLRELDQRDSSSHYCSSWVDGGATLSASMSAAQ